MKKSGKKQEPQPVIVKYAAAPNSGIESVSLSRYAIGYIIQGTKYVYYGDQRHTISRGDMFYMGVGHHYTENAGDESSGQFEQIIFYYTPEELQRILSHLNLTYGVEVSNSHSCEQCRQLSHISMAATASLKSFFLSCNTYMRNDFFSNDEVAENIKLTELVYMILSLKDCCLKNKLLNNIDEVHENFEQIVYDHIFKDVSIEELASASNRSLTSFKKEFKRRFVIPPHKWYIRQRLTHSRMLLLSTSKSISEIGNACAFPNTSHFIKLFKKEYNITPASYRNEHLKNMAKSREEESSSESESVPQAVGSN